jgi:hypothetical protein
MKAAPMGTEHLAAFLRQAADEVERHASMEGNISWSVVGLGTLDEPEGHEDGTVIVSAFVRNGNDMGQGGCWLVGQAEALADVGTSAPRCVICGGVGVSPETHRHLRAPMDGHRFETEGSPE